MKQGVLASITSSLLGRGVTGVFHAHFVHFWHNLMCGDTAYFWSLLLSFRFSDELAGRGQELLALLLTDARRTAQICMSCACLLPAGYVRV